MAADLQLGLNTGYWAGGPPPNAEALIAEAEALGFDSLWTSEAYGSDCISPLAWWGSKTEKLRLGTAIMQMSARQPAAAAMAAMTMDHLSGGRFILGIGVSGPQVVEGWYGVPLPEAARPHARVHRDHARHLGAAGAGDQRGPALPVAVRRPRPLDRPRQAAEVVDPSGPRGRADLPRLRGPEEHRPLRRALRRLDVDAVLAGPSGHLHALRSRRAGIGRAHAAAPTTSRSPAWCR